MASNNHISLLLSIYGGEGGIRTPGRSFGPYNGLANRRIQPLCHLSAVVPADEASAESFEYSITGRRL